jgi:hydrogenase maturation protease
LVAVRRLQEEIHDYATIREESGEGAALIEAWKEADAVILIDAMQSGAEPGTLSRFDAYVQPMPTAFFQCSTHAFSVAEAIELARALDQLPPHLVVYGIEGKTFASGVGLSPEVEKALEGLVERVRQEIERWKPATAG